MAKIKQPSAADQKELDAIVTAQDSYVPLRKKKVKVGWLRYGTIRKVTNIEMETSEIADGDDEQTKSRKRKQELQRNCKKVAAILLNKHWRIKLWWWLKWRWMYYVKEYSESELTPILIEAKKKVDAQAAAYYAATIYSTALTDMMMAMTKTEAERFRQGLLGAQPTP